MIPPVIPMQLYASVAAATQLTNRRAREVDGDPSSDDLAETFYAVMPSSSSQTKNSTRQVAARSKPFELQQKPDVVEDEEEKLLHVLASKFGLKHERGLSVREAASYLREFIYSPKNTYDIAKIEKELGLDIIGVTLKDFLDAMIDSRSKAAERTSLALKNFLDREASRLKKTTTDKSASDDENSDDNNLDDNDLGLYSPFGNNA